MAKINWVRVVLGGVVAGIVLAVLAGISEVLLVPKQNLQPASHALRPSTGGSAAAIFILFAFLALGVLLIASYAAIRPRFGAGPKTAAIAALAVWLTGVLLTIAAFALKNLALGEPFPLPSGPLMPCLHLLIGIASTLAGASLYHEQQG